MALCELPNVELPMESVFKTDPVQPCGESMYTDVRELSSGAAHQFLQDLTLCEPKRGVGGMTSVSVAAFQGTSPVSSSANQSSPTGPAAQPAARQAARVNSASTQAPSSIGNSKSSGPNKTSTSIQLPVDNLGTLPNKKFLLLCVNKGKYRVNLENVEVTNIGDDQVLFSQMRQAYGRIRGSKMGPLSLFIPVSVNIIKVWNKKIYSST